MANRTKFTPNAKAKFLKLLGEGKTITESCDAVGVARQTSYDHMREDPAFQEAVDQAVEIGVESSLIPVARNRAVDGWLEPVFYEGQEVGTIRRFDNVLLWKLITAKSKRYRGGISGKTDAGDQIIDLGKELAAARARAGISGD